MKSLEMMLQEVRDLLQLEESVTVRIKPLKSTLARLSFTKRVLTLDPLVLNLSEDLIFYILTHELAHLKANTPYHTPSFWREVERIYDLEDIKTIEERIFKVLKAQR